MKNVKSIILRILIIIIGNVVYSIGVNMFIIPHKFLSGGVSGVAIIFQYLTGIPSGYFVIAINIPIFMVGFKTVDRRFGIFSFIGMAAMSLSLIFTRTVHNFYYLPDPLLSALCSGMLTGVGAGIVFKCRASQGGTDIIAVAVKKKYGISIGRIGFGINAVIVSIGMIIGNLPIALYTLISMYMYSVVVDKMIEGFDRGKIMFIVTSNTEDVEKAIVEKLGRGVTYLYGEGAYTGTQKKIIYSIMNSRQVEEAKRFIHNLDANAVMSIMDASEVRGRGFKSKIF
ncbi:YitT family protein [Clostridium sp. WLY-B-L2]|uniref:YitT family protein n=1 Tax=Clostridium aromativorans TaxID=2836848 RepID=A0ABS8N6U1_9CLOT|nr:YitT family protein [Clostridium aromativorans]MCC9295540.1 YitT family protein [Clostridium aromativorans]